MSVYRHLLADPSLKPGKDEMLLSVAHMKEVLAIRNSSLSSVFAPRGCEARVSFYNTGPDQNRGDRDGHHRRRRGRRRSLRGCSFYSRLVCVNVTVKLSS